MRPILIAFFLVATGCSGQGGPAEAAGANEGLPEPFARLLPLHAKLGSPKPGEWLHEHPETGQTYRQYIADDPVRPDKQRKVLYVYPLGEFNQTQKKILALSADYMRLYFGLSVRVQDGLPLTLIPAKAQRTHPGWKVHQLLSTYVLDKVLRPRLPDDAMAAIALTTEDLWPGEGWNFVFGQASLSERVGVWSIARFGDPDSSPEAFLLCLRRTLKVATHETGHMFSMAHCTLYECNMCGGNNLVESDRHPLWLCPHCLAKLCWATGADPKKRFEQLAEFCRLNGLTPEQAFFERSITALEH